MLDEKIEFRDRSEYNTGENYILRTHDLDAARNKFQKRAQNLHEEIERMKPTIDLVKSQSKGSGSPDAKLNTRILAGLETKKQETETALAVEETNL